MIRSRLILLPLLLVPGLAGCVAVAAAAVGAVGFVQYDRNRAHSDFDVTLEEAWSAATAAASVLGYPPVTVRERTPTEGEYEAGEELWVRVAKHPQGFVCVAVRVGTFDTEDNRRRSGLFLNEVARQLGEEGFHFEETTTE